MKVEGNKLCVYYKGNKDGCVNSKTFATIEFILFTSICS